MMENQLHSGEINAEKAFCSVQNDLSLAGHGESTPIIPALEAEAKGLEFKDSSRVQAPPELHSEIPSHKYSDRPPIVTLTEVSGAVSVSILPLVTETGQLSK